jgi:hypothetical protein
MITIIEGPKKSGKSTWANSLRDRHISRSVPDGKSVPYGMLLLDEGQNGEPRHLIEKLLHGVALPADGTSVSAKSLKWKQEPSVVIVGKANEKLLDEFEKLVPGFKDKVGPVKRMKLA